MFLPVDFSKILCSSENELLQDSNAFFKEQYIPRIFDSFVIGSSRLQMSHKFVPLISCDITLFLREISRRCLLLYRVHVFRISVTGFPPSLFYHIL